MDTTTESKLESMISGNAVPLQIAELEQLESAGIEVRTAHNLDAVGTRSAPYVGWMSGSLSTSPPDLRIDPSREHRAYARPGRCRYSKSGMPLPDDYRAA